MHDRYNWVSEYLYNYNYNIKTDFILKLIILRSRKDESQCICYRQNPWPGRRGVRPHRPRRCRRPWMSRRRRRRTCATRRNRPSSSSAIGSGSPIATFFSQLTILMKTNDQYNYYKNTMRSTKWHGLWQLGFCNNFKCWINIMIDNSKAKGLLLNDLRY